MLAIPVAPFLAVSAVSTLESFFYSNVTAEKSENKTVEWIRSGAVAKYSSIQLIFNIENTAYCLYKIKSIKWLSFLRSIPQPLVILSRSRLGNAVVDKVECTYRMLALDVEESDKDCSICMDEAAAKTAFCAKHLFC